MPLIVLTSTQDEKAMQTTMGASNGQVAVVEGGWIALHDQLAAQSSRGVNCVIAGVGHFIQIDKPDVVIEAIRQVMALIPTQKKPSCAAWPSPTSRPTPH
jgi:pimeloyl-ACP methyl ester carboxylesterase